MLVCLQETAGCGFGEKCHSKCGEKLSNLPLHSTLLNQNLTSMYCYIVKMYIFGMLVKQ